MQLLKRVVWQAAAEFPSVLTVDGFVKSISAGGAGGGRRAIPSKLSAALITQRLYNFSPNEGLLMWSLSLPQAVAMLAAALVAFNTVVQQGQRLIDEPILNTIILLMVLTSILGPILTERFATQITGVKEEI